MKLALITKSQLVTDCAQVYKKGLEYMMYIYNNFNIIKITHSSPRQNSNAVYEYIIFSFAVHPCFSRKLQSTPSWL